MLYTQMGNPKKYPRQECFIVMILQLLRNPLVFVCILSLLVVVAGFSDGSEIGSINMTSGGIAWVTTMEGDELEHPDDKVTIVEQGEAGQDFNSIESMLKWAIGHSDPEKLKQSAQEAKRLTPQELEMRRADIKELMDRLRMPSDAELMKIAIADLQNSALSTEERQRALQELLILVEPIDNANDLDKLGGLMPVIKELERPEEELRTTAAWILGKACQNNMVVQKQVLQQGGLPRLMEMVSSRFPEEAVKALYAVSAIIRNFPLGQQAFYLDGGAILLEELRELLGRPSSLFMPCMRGDRFDYSDKRLLGQTSVDIRLRRKSLFLVADLAEQSHQLRGGQLDSILKISLDASNSMDLFNEGLLKAVVNLVEAPDLDTLEKYGACMTARHGHALKALMAVQSLVKVSQTVQDMLIKACHIEAALERTKVQLRGLLQDAERSDFAKDLEIVRQEVASSILDPSQHGNVQNLKDEL